jgi:hypothetical protein
MRNLEERDGALLQNDGGMMSRINKGSGCSAYLVEAWNIKQHVLNGSNMLEKHNGRRGGSIYVGSKFGRRKERPRRILVLRPHVRYRRSPQNERTRSYFDTLPLRTYAVKSGRIQTQELLPVRNQLKHSWVILDGRSVSYYSLKNRTLEKFGLINSMRTSGE